MDNKRLYRSDADAMLGGVAGGLAEYFKLDPTIVRLAFLLLGFVTGVFPAVLLYMVLWAVVPRGSVMQ